MADICKLAKKLAPTISLKFFYESYNDVNKDYILFCKHANITKDTMEEYKIVTSHFKFLKSVFNNKTAVDKFNKNLDSMLKEQGINM